MTSVLYAAPIVVETVTANGTVPGTAITYTISDNGSARAIWSPGSSNALTWKWLNNFPEFVSTGVQTLTVTFSAPVPINRLVLGVNSISNSTFTLTVGGGTAGTADFDLSDGLNAVGGTAMAPYNGATGTFTSTTLDLSTMIGSTSTRTLTQFTLTGNNGGDGYTLFFGTTVLPTLTVTKTGSPNPVLTHGTLTYTVATTNTGTVDADNVTVVDTLPAGAIFQSATGPGWSCGEAAGIVTCTRPLLVPGAAPAITIIVTAPAVAGSLTNNVTADADNALSPASGTTTTTVIPSSALTVPTLGQAGIALLTLLLAGCGAFFLRQRSV